MIHQQQSKSNSSDKLLTALAVEIYGNSMEIMTFGLHLTLPLLGLVHSSTVLFSMPENQTHRIQKNHRLTTLPKLGKEFKISFDLWVEEYHDSTEYNARYHVICATTRNSNHRIWMFVRYGNILHLTDGSKGRSYGSKTPMVQIWRGGFEVSSAIESSPGAWGCSIYREDISLIDISTLFNNIDIDNFITSFSM